MEKSDKTYDFNSLEDANTFDLLPAIIITIPIILIGFFPNLFIEFFDLGIKEIIK